MLRSSVAIAGIIGVAAISHRLLRHYLTPSEAQTPKLQSQDKNHNKAGCTEQEATMFNSDGTDVKLCCILDALCIPFKLWVELPCYQVMWMLRSYFCKRRRSVKFHSSSFICNVLAALEWREPVLVGNVMEALADPNTHLIGVYGFYDEIKHTLLERVTRRIQRDNPYFLVLTATVTKKPDVKKIQDELAHQLGFTFSQKSKDKRANELINRIKNEQNILIILRDLYKKLDLSKVGIPYGAHHMGCKILLISKSKHVLSDHMHTHKNFMVW